LIKRFTPDSRNPNSDKKKLSIFICIQFGYLRLDLCSDNQNFGIFVFHGFTKSIYIRISFITEASSTLQT